VIKKPMGGKNLSQDFLCEKTGPCIVFLFEEKLTSLHPKTGKKKLKLVDIEQTLLK